MANQNLSDGDAIKSDDVTPAAAPLPAAAMSRRRFAGLGASSVILTLASQPAMANSIMCTSLSAAGSVVHSRSTTVLVCNGRSPAHYLESANWAGTGVAPSSMFNLYFGTTGAGAPLAPYTLLQVIAGNFALTSADGTVTPPATDPDPHGVAKYVIATWLNVLSQRVSFFTVESVMTMWSEYATTLQYVPTAGADPWNGSTLVSHLNARMS